MLGNKFLLAEEILIFALKKLNVSQEPLDGDRKLLNPPYSLTSQGKEKERNGKKKLLLYWRNLGQTF